MSINFSKSSCLRIGPRNNVVCATITSSTGSSIPWNSEIRYLGVYLVKFRTVKCSLDAAKRGFYRVFNSIFGKIGHIASEEVILKLVSIKCIPILLYGLEVLPIRQSQFRSLDFMINRLFMKLFKTSDIRLVHLCQDLFHFHLPSELLQQRTKNSWTKYKVNLYINQCMCHACCLFVVS